MNSRDSILARIREALRQPAPLPGRHTPGAPAHPAPSPATFRACLPRVGPDWDEQCHLFAQNAASLRADFKRVPSAQAAGAELRRLAAEEGWKRLATQDSPLTTAATQGLGVELFRADQPHTSAGLEACDAGLSLCEALIAQTGSVLVSSRTCGGRGLSVLPHHHVVLATASQLLPDLGAAFDLLRRQYDGNYPSMMSFITGPSRTGDIERILVLGAHGPKKLTILMIEES